METVKINSKNIHYLIRYTKSIKALNKYVKENFNKEERKDLSVFPIINDIHKEVDILESEISKYINANAKDYIHKDMYLYGDFDSFMLLHDSVKYIHILNNPDKKRVKIDIISARNPEKNTDVYLDIEHSEVLSKIIVYSILDGKLKEIEKSEYEKIEEIYNNMRVIQKRIFKE